jgi:glycosyltransferase involved in cell wall biosynthesis
VIPNPIHIDADRAAWQLSTSNSKRLLFVGRFDRLKGGDIVLQTFAELTERDPDLRLSFVGPDRGLDKDDAKLSFEQFVQRELPAFCRSRIDFLGQLARRDVMALRTQHFCTIVASQYETFSIAVLEAMSLGCPIIASDVGGIPELITHERNGLLFASRDVAQLVAACRRLLDDAALASALGAQARKDCTQFFNPHQVALQTLSAYQAAIDSCADTRTV